MTLSGNDDGALMSLEMPPYAASIWSAAIDRDRDRDQRLAQVLARVPAQEQLLDGDADDADQQHGASTQRDDPADEVVLAPAATATGAEAQVQPAVVLRNSFCWKFSAK